VSVDGSTTRRPRDQRGSVSVLSIIVVVLAAALMFGVARVGLAAVLRTRAENAADAAALAAADQLALGHSTADAWDAAAATARANGAHLLQCSCSGAAAEVAVALDVTLPFGFPVVQGRARAEVDIASG
jgi:secretion/DNA translocation related TadE-like protein